MTVCSRAMISFGVQGIAEDKIEEAHAIIERTLADSAERGFDNDRIDGILHQMDLGQKHVRPVVIVEGNLY